MLRKILRKFQPNFQYYVEKIGFLIKKTKTCKCKLPKRKYSLSLSQHIQGNPKLFIIFVLFYGKQTSLIFFSRNCVSSTYSCLILTYLMIKSEKQTFAIVKWFTMNMTNCPLFHSNSKFLYSFIVKYDNSDVKISRTKYSPQFQ